MQLVLQLMMELGEPFPFAEEDAVLKEEEIFWNFENNIEMVDPLKIEVKEEKMNIKIESNYMVTSTQHEGNDIVDSQSFVKEEDIGDDSKEIVTSSNQSIGDVANGSVLPTGLLLYRLFNQIIIDALLGTQVNRGNQEVPSRNTAPTFEPEIDVMTSTQNWVNTHEFAKGRRPSRKVLKKNVSEGEVSVKNIKVDVISNSLNSTENLIVLTENNSSVSEKQNCNLCDKSRNMDFEKDFSVEKNDGNGSNRVKCTICDVDRSLNGLNYKKKLECRNNNEYISRDNDFTNHLESDNLDDLSGDLINLPCENSVNFEQNEIAIDSYGTLSNVIKKCYVIVNKMNVSDFNKYYVCPNCDNIFDNVITYENHKLLQCSFKHCNGRQTNELINYLCYVCGELFSQKTIYLFEKHLKLHVEEDEELKFCCRFCGKSTNSRSEFILHTKLHLDKDNFMCDKCDKIFINFNLLKTHNKKYHKNLGTCKLSCDFCKLSFTKRINHMKHKCVKFGRDIVKGHVCKICNETFQSIKALNLHTKKQHVRAKSFSCNDCNKSFTRKSSLLSHSKIVHEGSYDGIFVKL